MIVATWRRSILSVALEHWHYCPVTSVAMDPNVYADTGQRLPIGTASGGIVPAGGLYLVGASW